MEFGWTSSTHHGLSTYFAWNNHTKLLNIYFAGLDAFNNACINISHQVLWYYSTADQACKFISLSFQMFTWSYRFLFWFHQPGRSFFLQNYAHFQIVTTEWGSESLIYSHHKFLCNCFGELTADFHDEKLFKPPTHIAESWLKYACFDVKSEMQSVWWVEMERYLTLFASIVWLQISLIVCVKKGNAAYGLALHFEIF
jgi:hypothetical protein